MEDFYDLSISPFAAVGTNIEKVKAPVEMGSPQMLNTLDPASVGPHPSHIEIAKPYIFQHTITACLNAAGVTEAKDDSIRLQGVAWIDSVRKALLL